MARVNVGIDPAYLTDQHLIAESVEITMITGGLRKNGYVIKSPVPSKLALGAGHINFFKNKILYLSKRLKVVNNEMRNRGMNPGTHLDILEFPRDLCNDWTPNFEDSKILRERIFDRLISPLRAKKGFHRYNKVPIENLAQFAFKLKNSELYPV